MTEPHGFACLEVFRRLDDYLDRELSESEMARVAEHLDACAQCAQEQQFEARVLESIKSKLRLIKAPEHLLHRITAVLAAERGKPG